MIILADWRLIDDFTPKDHPILVYAPPLKRPCVECHLQHGEVCDICGAASGLMAVCQWHPSGGFCIDELRQPVIWTSLPYVPEEYA